MFKRLCLLTLLGLTATAWAAATPAPPVVSLVQPTAVQLQVEAELAKAPLGTRFGLLVVDEAGSIVAAINPDHRFIPASNTKLFTTAAAYALLPGMAKPDAAGGTQVALRPGAQGQARDVVLLGRGDARMSSAADCRTDCLATLADAVAAKVKVVGDVVGDDTWFPDQRWSQGMSWNNIGSNDGTAASALTLDNNELIVRVMPGAAGTPPIISAPPYVAVTNQAATVTGSKDRLVLEHTVNSREFRLYGTILSNAGEWHETIGIDDPAHYAAWTFAQMLTARGVAVKGAVRAVHRSIASSDDPAFSSEVARSMTFNGGTVLPPLARLTPPPLAEDVVTINKQSQNLHAELLLRRIGKRQASGSVEDGLAAAQAVFAAVQLPRAGYDFSDGSGMSTYNRISPRAGVALLHWISQQPWSKAWFASLPIAGVDGTLKRRFIGTPLAGNLIGKTGTLNATNGLSGTFRSASGRKLTFSFFANDVPNGESAVPTMEAVLLLVAAQS